MGISFDSDGQETVADPTEDGPLRRRQLQRKSLVHRLGQGRFYRVFTEFCHAPIAFLQPSTRSYLVLLDFYRTRSKLYWVFLSVTGFFFT